LVRYATRLVGDVERGQDIVQDVFVRLCREDTARTKDHVAAWLYTVCRNRALDVCKKEQRMSSLPPSAAEAAQSGAPDPAMAAERQEDASHASEMLNRLPEKQQEVLRLKIEHGLRYRQISEITGLSVSNVGYLLHQGLHTLRQQLASQQIE
jgi:RNA polymerase sigma-70 factor (ECF subfamily)